MGKIFDPYSLFAPLPRPRGANYSDPNIGEISAGQDVQNTKQFYRPLSAIVLVGERRTTHSG
jgi:hypothetical protein